MKYREFWKIVEKIVKSRNPEREVVKYSYVEKLWKAICDNSIKVIFLRAPTGIGKTEAVLAPYLHQYLSGEYSFWSLVYVLPTRSLVTTMYTRFCKTISSVLTDLSRGPMLTLDYGSPFIIKPYLEGDIVVTTYDTLIYTIYGLRSWGRHYRLPLAKITGSLIVLDEVQLMQDIYWYTPDILPKHLRFLISYASKVIVMSATLPSKLVNDIKREIIREIKDDEIIEINCLEEAERGNISIELHFEEIDEILSDLLRADTLHDKLPLLIVCNTVEKAANMYNKIVDQMKGSSYEIILLHSRLRFSTRKEREKIFERKKKRELILIATQVVEAGIDYNFRAIITECCPIDSLIQRIGRIARKPGDEGYAYISLHPQTIKRATYVYSEEIISRAKEVITNYQDKINIATKSSHIATSLVDEQYTDELVEKLSRKFKVLASYKRLVSAFICRLLDSGGLFLGQDVLRNGYNKILSHLIRLGIEINTVFLPTLNKLINTVISEGKKKLLIKRNIIDNNIVKLSLKVLPQKGITLPKSVLHHFNDKDYIIFLDISKNSEITIEAFKVNDKRVRDLYNILSSKILVLNSKFYKFKDNYDLGVVKI